MSCCAACADCTGSNTIPPYCAFTGMESADAANTAVRINLFIVILLVGYSAVEVRLEGRIREFFAHWLCAARIFFVRSSRLASSSLQWGLFFLASASC